MATLSTNKWYNRYLSEVANGCLELPVYEKNDDGSIKIYYGELFCCVPDCSKAQKKYTAINNLRTHIETHEDVELQEGNIGGRAAQKTVDEAVTYDVCVDASTPPLLVKKDSTVHITNMRKKVAEMGHHVPCNSCGNRNECCKDINKCDHFILFECGNIHTDPAGKGKAPVRSPQPLHKR
ncbi:hypothetical protein GB937_010865 [Aspergillus fischeri]|nr:hypothetical protein GB937_010865 [Aspergillus fischeri]